MTGTCNSTRTYCRKEMNILMLGLPRQKFRRSCLFLRLYSAECFMKTQIMCTYIYIYIYIYISIVYISYHSILIYEPPIVTFREAV